MKIEDITLKIIEIERNHNFFDIDVHDIKIWQLIRVKAYELVLASKFNTTNFSNKNSLFKKIQKASSKITRISNFLFYNPFFSLSKSDILIFESSRKVKFKNEFIDPYTKFISDDLIKSGKKVTKYQSSYKFDRLSKNKRNVYHLDFILLLSNYIAKFKIKNKIKSKHFNNIEKVINTEFNTKLHLETLCVYEASLFNIQSWFYALLLRIKNPQKIIIVNFSNKAALINEAKKRSIEVIEIQHGVMAKEDLIYHYPHTVEESLEYFPNKFYVWSCDKLLNSSKLPLNEENIIDYGNQFLNHQSLIYKGISKIKNQIIIASQGTLTKEILEVIVNNIDELTNYNILFKPHPNEYSTILDYPEIAKLKSHLNFNILPQDVNLFEALAQSSIFIAVYTSMIYEALHFKCKVILLNLPGIEMMKQLENNTSITILEDNILKF